METTTRPPRIRPLTPYLPWTDGRPRGWVGWSRLPFAAPFVALYLAVTWVAFFALGELYHGEWVVRGEPHRPFFLHLPDLSGDVSAAVRAFATAPWINRDWVQVVYVTVLLLLFGVVFEAFEGTATIFLVFYGTTLLACLVAGLILHLLGGENLTHPQLLGAWRHLWSGGSPGCFGIMGAFAARARRPWLLLALFFFWEANVFWWYLRTFTPLFHIVALTGGFVVMRLLGRRQASGGRR